MKKIFVTGIIALTVALVGAASASAAFNTNLSVGSTGADVSALQTWLISKGYDIPAISSGVASTGYFGQQTKTAVMAYQAANGIPNTGFVGPLTRAALNAGGVATVPGTVACPVGFVCTPVAGTTPTTPAPTGTITTPGVAGTLAVSLQSTPSNGTSVDKGQSADVVRYKLQAGASDQQVTSIALDFDSRFWLYASSVIIKDDAGNVIASKSNLSQADFTELTVGTNYRLYVPVNFVVAKAATRYVTVNVSMLPVTDRSAATLGITQVQVRSVDGTGVTDTQTVTSTRTFSYTGSNNGQVIVTVNSSSPLKRLVQISTSAETDNVTLGVFDVKSQNRSGTLRTFKVTVQTSTTSPATLFSDLKIKAGNMTYSANSGVPTTSGGTATFTDLQIALPADTYVPITVIGKINKSTNNVLDGLQASTTLTANTTNVAVEDSTFNTISVNSGTFISSDQIFSASSAVLSNLSAVLGAPVVNNDTTTAYPVTFKYTMTAGDNTLYVSAVPTLALATTSTGYSTAANASTTLTDVTANPGSISGDSSGAYYVIPAGASREFVWSGTVQRTSVSGGLKTFSITAVNYGTSVATVASSTINYNLESLKVSPVF